MHLTGAEGGVQRELFVLAVELLCVQHVERMVYIAVVAGRELVVVQRVVAVEYIGGRDGAIALACAASQLVRQQKAVLFVEECFYFGLVARLDIILLGKIFCENSEIICGIFGFHYQRHRERNKKCQSHCDDELYNFKNNFERTPLLWRIIFIQKKITPLKKFHCGKYIIKKFFSIARNLLCYFWKSFHGQAANPNPFNEGVRLPI